MMACYLTRVPLQTNAAWVLNSVAARRYRAELVALLATIDRQLETLKQSDKEIVQLPGDSLPVTRNDRRLLCKAVAETLVRCLGRQDLFSTLRVAEAAPPVKAQELAASDPGPRTPAVHVCSTPQRNGSSGP